MIFHCINRDIQRTRYLLIFHIIKTAHPEYLPALGGQAIYHLIYFIFQFLFKQTLQRMFAFDKKQLFDSRFIFSGFSRFAPDTTAVNI